MLECYEIRFIQQGAFYFICIAKIICKLIDINFFRRANTSINHQINFTGRLEDDGARTDLISEKQQRTTLNFSLDSLNVTE